MDEPTASEVERIRTVYDGYRDEAGRKWSRGNPGNLAMVAERNDCIVRLLGDAGLPNLEGRRVLDVGCGGGELLQFFAMRGARPADLSGVDLLPERIAAARELLPGAGFSVGNAERLEFADASFDLVTLFTVFSSILDARMSTNLAREVVRVLRPDGRVLIYEFRVPSLTNRHTRPLGRRRIRGLFPGAAVTARSLTVVPPLARRLGGLTGALYPICARLPFLRTHNLLMVRPRAGG